jgi:death-on-curing protein
LPNEPRWLPIDAVIEKNRLEVEETGERHFLRDTGLLEGALARPQNAFAHGEEDIVILAVRLLAAIAQAHAFEQGNKRTAFGAMWHFLRLNGYDRAASPLRHRAPAVIPLHRPPLARRFRAHDAADIASGRAILLPPVRFGGLGSRLRFPRSRPTEAAFVFQGPNFP